MTDQERIEALCELAFNAIESIEDWAGYASDYFREKHKLTEELTGLRKRLAALEVER